MKNIKYILLIVLVLNLKAFSQDIKEQKQDLYILFSSNDKIRFIKNDSLIYISFDLDYGKDKKFNSIKLEVDKNNNLNKNYLYGGARNPCIRFQYLSKMINHNQKCVDIKKLKNILEEEEIIKYIDINNLIEILNKFNVYAVKNEDGKYFAYKVTYDFIGNL